MGLTIGGKYGIIISIMLHLLFSALVSISLPNETPVTTDTFVGVNDSMTPITAHARLCRRHNALEVEIYEELKPGEKVVASGYGEKPESMFVNGGRTVELILAPRPDVPSLYYHFIANPSNALYQACRRDQSWKAPVQVNSYIASDRWGVHFTIPYSSLELTPADGDVWKANFAVGGASWTGAADYHNPLQFGSLHFNNSNSNLAYVEKAERGLDGVFRVTYAFPPAPNAEISHKNGGASYELELASSGKPASTFTIADQGNDAHYVVLDRYYYLAHTNLTLSYRSQLMGISTIRIIAMCGGKTLQSFENCPNSGALKLAPLNEGEYIFEMDDSHNHLSCQFSTIDQSTNSIGQSVNRSIGQSFYPVLGSEHLPSDHLKIYGSAPVRLVREPSYGFLYQDLPLLTNSINNLARFRGSNTIHRLAYEAQFNPLLKSVDGSIAPIANPPDYFYSLYRRFKDANPSLQLSIHLDNQIRAEEYARACDILEYAYPASSYSKDLIKHLPEAVSEAKRIANGKPAILWLGVSVPDNGLSRTAEELNLAIHYSIMKGLAGNILHLGHGGIPESNTRLWSFMRGCEKRINAWYPYFVAGKDDVSPQSISAEPGIEFASRRYGERLILIAVNFSRFTRRFVFTDPTTGLPETLLLPGYGSIVRY